ncbi:MAG: tetratricopeptide repeat protein, partial [Candidatus Binatia bacterium]|nr:tetratricopeptide repeat protein [Candidatus Binatia bacterium]
FAMVLDNMAPLIKTDSWSFPEAEKLGKQNLTIIRSLAASNPAAFRPILAATLNSLASFYGDYLFWNEAVTTYEESLGIIRELAAANPAAYRPALASTLRNLARLYALTWKTTESKNAYQEALTIFRELVTVRPAVYKPVVASVLNGLARAHLGTKEQREAENNFLESIALYRELVAASPTIYQPALADTLLNFVMFVAHPDLTAQELRYAEEAVEIYRKLWLENSDRYASQFSYALVVLTFVVSRSKDATPTACRLAREVEIVTQHNKVIQDSVGNLLRRACH